MFKFFGEFFPHLKSSFRASETEKLCFLQLKSLSNSPNAIQKSKRNHEDERLFVANYLINTCGFTPEKALSASKYLKFRTQEKPDSVISFFKKHGFTETQISNLARRYPPVLLCDPEKILLPKIEYFQSIGLSDAEVKAMVSLSPKIFGRNLEKQLIPSSEFIKGLFRSHAKCLLCLRRWCAILCYDLQASVIPNVEILREFGVPQENICLLFKHHPRLFGENPDKFKRTVKDVKEMGFNPLRLTFVFALRALMCMTKSTWEKKVEVYKKWDWSENEILEAFGKHPLCMTLSEDKIMGIMDLLVNKMGFERSVVLKRPVLLSLSLQRRMIPRCMVYQALSSKGLVPKNFSLSQFMEAPEKKFLKKFVESFEEDAPELLMLYRKNLPLPTYVGQNT